MLGLPGGPCYSERSVLTPVCDVVAVCPPPALPAPVGCSLIVLFHRGCGLSRVAALEDTGKHTSPADAVSEDVRPPLSSLCFSCSAWGSCWACQGRNHATLAQEQPEIRQERDIQQPKGRGPGSGLNQQTAIQLLQQAASAAGQAAGTAREGEASPACDQRAEPAAVLRRPAAKLP